jgi:rhodanese-related sulfurtransferase
MDSQYRHHYYAFRVGRHLYQKAFFRKPDSPTIGPSAKIVIEGLDWTKSEQTLLVAIRKDCQFCAESTRFYRESIQGLNGRSDIRVVALFPEGFSEAENYLSEMGLSVSETKEALLPSLGIQRVPTLALIDKNGIVSNVWIGKLPPKIEAEVIAALRLTNARPVSDWTMDEKELKRRIDNHEPMIILDLRTRTAYAQNHRDGSKNIPLDELDARAINELSQTDTIVLDSGDDLMTDSASMTLSKLGFNRVFILQRDSTNQ